MPKNNKKMPENPLADFGLADVVRGITQQDEIPEPEEPQAEEPQEKPKATAEHKPTATDKAAAGMSDEWKKFVSYAEDYYTDESKGRGVTVWIDEDVKEVLDKIKSSGEVKVPVRHMVSSMCRIFIEEHKQEVLRVIAKGRKKNSLL